MDFEIKVVNNIFISTKNSSNALGDIWFIHGFGGSSLSFRKLLSTNLDGFVKSRHPGKSRGPDKLQAFDITGFRLPPE